MVEAILVAMRWVIEALAAALLTTVPATEQEAEPATENSCVFAFYSDPHGDNGYHRGAINVMISILDEPELTEAGRPIQLVVSGGDNVDTTRNCIGCDGDNDFCSAVHPLIWDHRIPIYSAEGNHDFDFRRVNGWSSSCVEEDWPRPSRVECGSDAALYIMPWDIGERTIRRVNSWLDEEPRKWIILILHQPLYPCAARRQDDSRARLYRELFEPIIGQFALVLAGHDHVYCERVFGVDGSGVRRQVIVNSGPKHYSCAPDLVFPGENSGDTNFCLEDEISSAILIVWTTEDEVRDEYVPIPCEQVAPGTNPGPGHESD